MSKVYMSDVQSMSEKYDFQIFLASPLSRRLRRFLFCWTRVVSQVMMKSQPRESWLRLYCACTAMH